MTYCVALKIDAGMVFASDSRTNAGMDQVNTCRKMHTFVQAGERVLTHGVTEVTEALQGLLAKARSEKK